MVVELSRKTASLVVDLIGVQCANEQQRERAERLTLITLESLRAALAGISPGRAKVDH